MCVYAYTCVYCNFIILKRRKKIEKPIIFFILSFYCYCVNITIIFPFDSRAKRLGMNFSYNSQHISLCVLSILKYIETYILKQNENFRLGRKKNSLFFVYFLFLFFFNCDFIAGRNFPKERVS